MKSLNINPKNTSSTPLLKAAVSTLALGTALILLSSFQAQAHSPLTRADGPITIDDTLMGDPRIDGITAEIESLIADNHIDKVLSDRVSPGAKDAARRAYAQDVFAPLWNRTSAERLADANLALAEHGLDPEFTDHHLRTVIRNRLYGTDVEKARSDILLTAIWLKLTSKISGGLHDDGGMVRSIDNRPTRSDVVVSLRQAGQSDPILAINSLAPEAPQYDMLKSALKQYREYAEAGGWMKIRDDEYMLEPGMNDARIPALRKRLAAEGYVTDDPLRIPPVIPSMEDLDYPYAEKSAEPKNSLPDTVYDHALVRQLKTFQAAHGLVQDGVLGPATLAALNESVESKIDRIKRAMGYWRTNDDLGERYIWVNIPSYRAEAWTSDRRDITMDTIVGKKRTPTTAFSDEIEYIVVNPKWFLPIGLFKRQKLRKLQNDPSYAERHNYIVYDRASGEELNPHNIDWEKPDVARRIQMVQTPGPHNALGELKIIFPNKHAIYLHDTPDRHLFERDVRALSSGCIRLADPVKMANWLTDGDQGVATNVFNATLESRERDRFYMDKHVPVHLTYLPAVVNPEGRTEFPADIYQRFKTPRVATGVYLDPTENEHEQDFFVDMEERTAEANLSTRALP